MATCKASGKVCKEFGKRKSKKSFKMRNPLKPNKHRMTPAKLRGFHSSSLQMKTSIKGIYKRYTVNNDGTIINLKEAVVTENQEENKK